MCLRAIFPFKKCSLQLIIVKRRHFFSALGPESEKQIKLIEKKFALTCSFQKVIWILAF